MGASVNFLKKETYKIVKLNSVLVGVAFVEVMLSVSAKKGLGQNLSEQVQIVIKKTFRFEPHCVRKLASLELEKDCLSDMSAGNCSRRSRKQA